jgi:hypothetical protein
MDDLTRRHEVERVVERVNGRICDRVYETMDEGKKAEIEKEARREIGGESLIIGRARFGEESIFFRSAFRSCRNRLISERIGLLSTEDFSFVFGNQTDHSRAGGSGAGPPLIWPPLAQRPSGTGDELSAPAGA